MIPVSPAIITYGRRDGACGSYQFFQTFAFIGSAGNGFVQVVYISLVVFTMVYLHGCGIDIRLQRIGSIRKGW
jgi:hypothetical protein